MTSSNGNIFRVTGHFCGEFTGPRRIPHTKAVTRSFDVFFDLRSNKRLSKQWRGWWFDTQLCPLWRHRNENNLPKLPKSYWSNDTNHLKSGHVEIFLCSFEHAHIDQNRHLTTNHWSHTVFFRALSNDIVIMIFQNMRQSQNPRCTNFASLTSLFYSRLAHKVLPPVVLLTHWGRVMHICLS